MRFFSTWWILSDTEMCGLAERYQRYGGSSCLYLMCINYTLGKNIQGETVASLFGVHLVLKVGTQLPQRRQSSHLVRPQVLCYSSLLNHPTNCEFQINVLAVSQDFKYFNCYETCVAAFKYHWNVTIVSIGVLWVLSSLFSRLHVNHKHIKICHVIFNPIKIALNCTSVIDSHDALRRIGPSHLASSQRRRQLMFPETSDAARQVTLRDTMRRDASVKASKTGYVRRTSREKATNGWKFLLSLNVMLNYLITFHSWKIYFVLW